jgi:hypothetical protein
VEHQCIVLCRVAQLLAEGGEVITSFMKGGATGT